MNSFTCLGVDIAFCKLPLLAFAISTVPEEMNTWCGPLLPGFVRILPWGQCPVASGGLVSPVHMVIITMVLGLLFLVP